MCVANVGIKLWDGMRKMLPLARRSVEESYGAQILVAVERKEDEYTIMGM